MHSTQTNMHNTRQSPCSIEQQASELVNQLATKVFSSSGVLSMSTSICDTAWASMIIKTVDGVAHWRFPQCFDYVLQEQLPSGGWRAYAKEVDGILNTMAGLLAVKAHLTSPKCQPAASSLDLEDRMARATISLGQQLNECDVRVTVHVGFEVLVPALLARLEETGSRFGFSGRKLLYALNEIKLAKLDHKILYTKRQTTLIHSLEAFVGDIDFTSTRHHLAGGSMMASPSSTAAYLMHSSQWDSEAEAYIENTISWTGIWKWRAAKCISLYYLRVIMDFVEPSRSRLRFQRSVRAESLEVTRLSGRSVE